LNQGLTGALRADVFYEINSRRRFRRGHGDAARRDLRR
jgi:hypothetical protein